MTEQVPQHKITDYYCTIAILQKPSFTANNDGCMTEY